jgi:hypothetical protein
MTKAMPLHLIFSLFLGCLLTGCTGYRFAQQENPLAQYGIQSLSVPMFYNYSNLSEVSADFTRETYTLLTNFSGLKLVSGYSTQTDAVLIGIVRSPERMTDSLRPGNLREAQDRAGNALGGSRGRFYIPGTTDVTLMLQIIVIKKPSEEELALLRSGIGDKIQANSRIIFNEMIPLRSQFTREIFDNDPTGPLAQRDGTSVIATQNAGLQRKSIDNLAAQAAIQVRDMILYAF